MALASSQVIIAATGHYYIGASGSTITAPVVAKPSSLPVDGSAWTPTGGYVEVGHTSADSPLTIGRDGGDTTTNGTWQAPNLEVSVAPVTFSLQFSLLQLDTLNSKLYYGGGSLVSTDFIAPTVPTAQSATLLVQVIHSTGTRAKWLYFPKTSIIGSDNAEAATDDFMSMPVTATILDSSGDVGGLAGLFSISGA